MTISPIDPQPRNYRRVLVLILVITLISLAGCRRGGANAGPTLQPTQPPTPRSTALPEIPTAEPIGSDDNPIRMLLERPTTGSTRTTNSTAEDLADSLIDATGLNIAVELVETQAEAVAALCASPSGEIAVVWVNGLGYAAANAQGCGSPSLWIRRESGRETQTAESVIIITHAEADTAIDTFDALSQARFCRLNYNDLYTWLVPSLILGANGVSTDRFESITNYETTALLIEAVAAGDCDGAGVTEADFEELARGDTRTAINTLGEGAAVPYAILMLPRELPLGARTALNDALLDSGDTADALETLLGGSVIAVEDADLAPFNTFLNSTGFDFALAGD